MGGAGERREPVHHRNTLNLCSTLGVRVVEVSERLPRPVMFCGVERIAFVDVTVSPEALRESADWLLRQALQERP